MRLILSVRLFWKLRVAKGQPTQAVASQPSANKNMPLTSEWGHASQPTTQQSNFSSNTYERSVAETAEEIPIMEDEGILSRSPNICFHYGIKTIDFLKIA